MDEGWSGVMRSGAYPRVEITEEGMREGMQIESAEISVADKIRLLDALSNTGLKEIVVGSFVSPKWTPQMANIEQVVAGFQPRPGVRYTALVANEKGRERARQFMPPLSEDERSTALLVHLCDVFVQRNYNRTQAQEIAAWPRTIERALVRGATTGTMVLGAAWGSNWVGDFTDAQRLTMLRRMHTAWTDAGITVTGVGFLDPMGWNMPDQVERLLKTIKAQWPAITEFYFHLHDTRGTALTSVYAALNTLEPTDTLRLDAAIGGMAGCPYCGNGRAATLLCTEDLVHFLEELGVPTGVDLDRLVETVWLAESIVGHQLYGHVSKAGPRPRYERRYPMDMPFVETLAQARHFLLGPSVYEGALSPWTAPISSFQRAESTSPTEQAAQDSADVDRRASAGGRTAAQ
jgi:hydroxymethylglutaryl-CoA lyase